MYHNVINLNSTFIAKSGINPKNETRTTLKWYFIVIGILIPLSIITSSFESYPSLTSVLGSNLREAITGIGILILGAGWLYFGVRINTYLQGSKSSIIYAWLAVSAIASITSWVFESFNGLEIWFIAGLILELFILWYIYAAVSNLSKK